MSARSGEPASPKTPKVGLLSGWFQSSGEALALHAARTIAEALGSVGDVELPMTKSARSAAFILTASEGGQRHIENLRTRPMEFDPATRDRLIAGALLPNEVIRDAETVAEIYIDQMTDTLSDFDILIAPSTPSTAPDISAGMIEIDGKRVSARANLGLYAQPLSLAGVPILSVPLKRPPGALPIGVQLVAAQGRENLLFDTAETLVSMGLVEAELPVRIGEVAL